MSDNTELMSAEFFPEFVRITLNGSSPKNISWEDFLKHFNESFKLQIDELTNGPSPEARGTSRRLPQNAVFMDEASDRSIIKLNLYFPERMVTLKYDQGSGEDPRILELEECPLPNILVYVELARNNTTGMYALNGCRYFCTHMKLEELDFSNGCIRDPDHRKHIWPLALPNMYDSGNMCYGGNSTVNTLNSSDLSELQWQYDLIFESPFNSDLNVPGQDTGRGARSWLRFLSDQSIFPYWELYGSPFRNEEEYRRQRVIS